MTKPFKVYSVSEILATPDWKISDYLTLHKDYLGLKIYSNNNEYPIEYERMNTPAKVCGWIFHLVKKHNVTKEHIEAFLRAARDRGVDINFHS